MCCLFESVCELVGKTIRNMFGCGCYFVVVCYGVVWCAWRCSIDRIWFSKERVCVVSVMSLCVWMLLLYGSFVFCMSKVIFSFKSLRAGSHGFALFMLFICVVG